MGQELRGRIPQRKMDVGFIEGVGCFIYCSSTHRYLFLLRSQSKYAGTWGLPGGKIDGSESPIDTLTREIKEELGGCINNAKIIPIEQFTSDNGNFVYHTFFIPVEEEFVPELNEEHKGYCWVHLEDHPKPLHPGVWRTINFSSVCNKIKTAELVL